MNEVVSIGKPLISIAVRGVPWDQHKAPQLQEKQRYFELHGGLRLSGAKKRVRLGIISENGQLTLELRLEEPSSGLFVI